MLGYPLGDVAAILILQIVMVLLLKAVAEHFSLPVAVGAAIAYIGVMAVLHFCTTPYYIKNRPADTRQEMVTSLGSQPLRAVILTMMFVVSAQSLRCATLSFYFYDYVDSQSLAKWLAEWSVTTTQENVCLVGLSAFLVIGAVAQVAGAVLFSKCLSVRFGKKETFIGCLELTAFFSLLLYMPQPDDISLMFVLCILKSLAFAPTIPLLWAMTGDVADHVEQLHHRRATGFCFSRVMLALKTGLGLGGFWGGVLLIAFGYTLETEGMQTWTAVEGIRWASTIIPALLFTAALLTLWTYPITKSYGERIQAELTERRNNVYNNLFNN